MKITFLYIFVFCISIKSLSQTLTDSIYALPSAEIVATRLNTFTLGQTQLQSDSMTLQLFENQPLNAFLQAETPLSIKSYGTGIALLSARGMAANHTAILWNGINIQNPINGINDLAILDVGTTQQVSIKMGGSSALFGSGAMGSLVSLDNKKSEKRGFHARLSYGLGSYDWQNRVGDVSFNREKWGVSLRLMSQKADNDFRFRNTAEAGHPIQRAQNAAFNLFNVSGNAFFQPSKNDFLKFHFWQSHNFREVTPTMTSTNDYAFYRDTANRWTGEWAHFFKKSFVRLRGAFLYDKNVFQSEISDGSRNGARSYIGEAEWNYNFSEKHQFRMGVINTTDVSDNSNYAQNQRRRRLALFVNEAIQTRWLTLSGNVRQELVGNDFTPLIFSCNIEKKINQKNAENTSKTAWVLRGGISRNFNVPTFNDLYWERLGNPNLVNELGWSREIGVTFKQKIGENRLESHLTFFDLDIKNRITWLPQSDSRWRPTNLNQFFSRGIETWATYFFTVKNAQTRIRLNYQFAHATDGAGGVQLYTPRHNGSLSAWLRYKNAYFSWQQSASSRRYGTTDRINWTNPFTVADATVGYTPSVFSVKKYNFGLKPDLKLQITNVFNTDYQVIRYFPNPRRQVRLVMSCDF
jgi:vitamin B12 transporter